MPDLWEIERALLAQGRQTICGIDEAGRGPLAGPVFAAAVVLPPDISLPGLNDSKKLAESKRVKLYAMIIEGAAAYSVASADHTVIDSRNILNATFLAMRLAFEMLSVKPDFVLIDGNMDPGLECDGRCVVGGDGKSASIAAASILAKVSRDRFMAEIAGEYPEYAFEKHKGYGTRLHYERLNEYGPCAIHRMTFLKKWEACKLKAGNIE